MSDETPAPAESVPAPTASPTLVDSPGRPAPASNEPEPQAPKPVESTPPPKEEPKKDEPKQPISTRDALKKAAEKVEKASKEPAKEPAKEQPKEPAKEPAPRAEDGKFAPKEPRPAAEQVQPAPQAAAPSATKNEAPARFSAEAKAEWTKAHPAVQSETTRAITELTQGIEKYKPSAERYESLREVDEEVRKHGTDIPTALRNYRQAELMLDRDLVSGLDWLARNKGTSLRQIAEHITGQTSDQRSAEADQAIHQMRQQGAQLAQENAQLKQQIQSFHMERAAQEVEAIKGKIPRYEELRETAGRLIGQGIASTLDEAFDMAGRLKPGAANGSSPTPPASPAAPVLDFAAQTAKGSKSIAGAPTPGSDPAQSKQPSSSIKEALRRAMAQAG